MRIIVTGGAGYIGSHICLELLRKGHSVCVIDNLSNGKLQAIERVRGLTNRELVFTHCDIRNNVALKNAFRKFMPDVVIHLAALKAVAESIVEPAHYYDVNVGGTAVLLNAMDEVGCDNIVFSSSATVYGIPEYLPCDEKHALQPINPYGRTKLIGEQLINDWSLVREERHAVALRYFNPVGADYSGIIGEDPNGMPNNLMPIIANVALGKKYCLQVFGDDYDTLDGTAIRDYIHVTDVAQAHVVAVESITMFNVFEALNIGTGKGVSVLEIIREFELQSNCQINFVFAPRRPGDAPAIWADASLASQRLEFQVRRTLTEMCRDAWMWYHKNPSGYHPN